MSKENNVAIRNSWLGCGGICFILFIVFMILKLIGSISWSWWYVCIPLYVMGGVWLLVFTIVFLCTLFVGLTAFKNK